MEMLALVTILYTAHHRPIVTIVQTHTLEQYLELLSSDDKPLKGERVVKRCLKLIVTVDGVDLFENNSLFHSHPLPKDEMIIEGAKQVNRWM